MNSDATQNPDRLTLGSIPTISSRAWYQAPISDFLQCSPEFIVGTLTAKSDFPVVQSQASAWLEQIEIIRSALVGTAGEVFFEFNIPRMGRRIDAVILIGPIVFAVEFKTGTGSNELADSDQVWDYALDLKNFHEASHDVPIVPILITRGASASPEIQFQIDPDKVCRPIRLKPEELRRGLDAAVRTIKGPAIEGDWSGSPYHPTPTIVEAARALYAQHSVEAIARHDAGARNLRVTSRRVEELIDEARSSGSKIICFVTGVPGAGKTLVGLNVATRRREHDTPTHAVFLSGNGPLVAVLREALTRDEVERRKKRGEKVRKAKVAESVKAFIQPVHHFRDEALKHSGPPIDHVAIFDEAQRAWNDKMTGDFMRRKRNVASFVQSEPEFLISYMNRHNDWAVIVCLVGGGQEIHRGEAGIDAWLDAVHRSFPEWKMYISSKLTDSEYAAGKALDRVRQLPNAYLDDNLHLSVSMRSYRAENVSTFVKALLDCDKQEARYAFAEFAKRYPVALTRDLNLARRWIHNHARGSERYGLVASSKAQRLKPHAVDVRVDVDPVQWFLNGKDDTRSSYYLEDAATEFQVQGLELDWVCVTWDADLRFTGSGWSHHDFRGDRWCNIANTDNRNYRRNAYRVLLTRARQGMVIFVPPGDSADHTRSAAYYDATFNYLSEVGIPVLLTA